MESITDNSNVVDRVVTTTNGIDVITVTDGASTNTQIDSNSGSFESVTVANPLHSLTINAGNGADTIKFNALLSTSKMVLDGGDGSDTIDVSGRAIPMSVIKFSDGTAALVD